MSTKPRSEGVLLFAAGMSVGWLTGMSVSPVVQGILTAVLAAVIAVACALAGLDSSGADESAKKLRLGKVSVAPVALLSVGIALGAGLGVATRTHGWLAHEEVDASIKRWTRRGLDGRQIAQRLFDEEHPIGGSSPSKSDPAVKGDVLFGTAPQRLCDTWHSLTAEELLNELKATSQSDVQRVAVELTKPEAASALLSVACGT